MTDQQTRKSKSNLDDATEEEVRHQDYNIVYIIILQGTEFYF